MLLHFCVTLRLCLPTVENMTYRPADENYNRIRSRNRDEKINEEKQSKNDGTQKKVTEGAGERQAEIQNSYFRFKAITVK